MIAIPNKNAITAYTNVKFGFRVSENYLVEYKQKDEEVENRMTGAGWAFLIFFIVAIIVMVSIAIWVFYKRNSKKKNKRGCLHRWAKRRLEEQKTKQEGLKIEWGDDNKPVKEEKKKKPKKENKVESKP